MWRTCPSRHSASETAHTAHRHTTNPHSHEAAGVVIQLIAARIPGALPLGNATDAAPCRIETCRQQQTPARRLRSSAALEVVLRGQQDLLPHADRVVVRLAGLGLVVGD